MKIMTAALFTSVVLGATAHAGGEMALSSQKDSLARETIQSLNKYCTDLGYTTNIQVNECIRYYISQSERASNFQGLRTQQVWGKDDGRDVGSRNNGGQVWGKDDGVEVGNNDNGRQVSGKDGYEVRGKDDGEVSRKETSIKED
jgi:hypothetical protein